MHPLTKFTFEALHGRVQGLIEGMLQFSDHFLVDSHLAECAGLHLDLLEAKGLEHAGYELVSQGEADAT